MYICFVMQPLQNSDMKQQLPLNSFSDSSTNLWIYLSNENLVCLRRKELELTDLALPERIVKLACQNYKLRERDQAVAR
jgi:hypothetical protein